MMEKATAESLHRTAKYFMDSGRAASYEEALALLRSYALCIKVGPEISTSRDHQIALLTLVNVSRRTFLGGVHVVGLPHASMLCQLCDTDSIQEAVLTLGGSLTAEEPDGCPVALIGSAELGSVKRVCWQITWDGWRGGVTPYREKRRLPENNSGGLAPVLAAALCASEAFTFVASDHPLAGRRSAGMSLWRPAADWLSDPVDEPSIQILPSRLWLIGLGNLGQAYAWTLASLAYPSSATPELILQDFDRLAESNDSTSVLSSMDLVPEMKTRAVSRWLERQGFRTFIEERHFGAWTSRAPHEPGVALCGVDNMLARSALEQAGFGLVVETGLGAGPHGFRSFSLHTFPSSLSAAALWAKDGTAAKVDVSDMPAYRAKNNEHLDQCGLAQMASRTIGVPFVGLTAAALAISEVLRRLHGGMALELLAGSVLVPSDLELSPMSAEIYEFGFVQAAR
jgi:hypothetical protein